MASFVLRKLDPAFWSRVQAKARAEGVTVKAVIVRLLLAWLGVAVLALLVSACSDVQTPNMLAPSPTPPVTQVASTLTLTAMPGTGATASNFYVAALVKDASGLGMRAAVVHLTTTTGTVQPDTMTADGSGLAQSVVTTSATTTIVASSGAATMSLTVTPGAPPTTPTAPTPVPTPTPAGPPTPEPLTVTLFAVPGAAGTATTFGLASPALVQEVWTFGDSSAPLTTTSPSASHVYASAGTYTAGVTVTDTIGRTASGSTAVTIVAGPAPSPPPAPFLASIASCTLGAKDLSTGETPVSCNASAAFNGVTVASTMLTVTWDFGDSGTGSGVIVTHRYAQAGIFLIVAHVTAASGDAFASKSVVVP